MRGEEHLTGLDKEWEMAPLWRHAKVFHGGVKDPDWFDMKVQRTHRTPLYRQVAEGVEINLCQADVILNSKGEWNGSRLPRMLVERGEQIELEENDVNVRMMNWEQMSGARREVQILEGTKRKSSDSDSEQEVRGRQEEQVNKKRKVDLHKQVKEVSKVNNKITNYFSKEVVEIKVQEDNLDLHKQVKERIEDKVQVDTLKREEEPKTLEECKEPKEVEDPLVLERVREGETKNKTCYLVDISLDVKETEKGVQITPP